MREQAMREAALARNTPQSANPAPQQNPIPTQVAPPQEVQVPPQVTHQVQDMASQAVEAFRAPAQSAASGCCLVFGRRLEGYAGFVRSTTPFREGGTSASATWTIVWQHGSNNPTREGWDCAITHSHSGTHATGSPGSSGTKGGGKGKTCKYFLSPKGCKYGAACRSPHSMAELSKPERFKKCLNCGSEEHRAAECKATRKQDFKLLHLGPLIKPR